MLERLRRNNITEGASLDDLFPATHEPNKPYVPNEKTPSIFQVLVKNTEPLESLSVQELDDRIKKFNEGIIILELHLRDLHIERASREER